MRRHIRLSDCVEIPLPDGIKHYKQESISQAIKALVKAGLRFDNLTGIMRDNHRRLEQPVRPRDFTPWSEPDEVLRWEFSRYIYNAASRIERGFSPT